MAKCKHPNLEPAKTEDRGARGTWFLNVRCKDCGRTGYVPIDIPDADDVEWTGRTKVTAATG